jgi:rhodanese-related sulfurtransferase
LKLDLARKSIAVNQTGKMLAHKQAAPVATASRLTQQACLSRPRPARPFQVARQHSRRSGSRQIVRANAATDNGKLPKWELIYKYLKEDNDLRSLSSRQAKELVDSGEAIIVDVRPRNLFKDATPIGAKSAPLFQLVDWSKPSFTKVLRAGALLANGVTPVEPNPDFLEDVRRAADGKAIILACEGGGSTVPTPSFQWGKASRSLTAAYRVLRAKAASPVYHLQGGIYGWYTEFGDSGFTGEYDTGNIGRTPNAAAPAEYPGSKK